MLPRNIAASMTLFAGLTTIAVACDKPAPTAPSATATAGPSASSAAPKPAENRTMPLAEFCKELRAKLDAMVATCRPKPETEDLFKILKLSVDEMAADYAFCPQLENVEILADKVPSCLAEVRTHWQGALVHIAHTPACRDAFVGKTGPGAKCRSDLECVAGSFCVADPASSDPLAEVCSPPMAAGVTCIEHRGEACGPDLDCVAGKCTLRPGAGEACSASSQNCAPGLTCLLQTSTDKEGKCGPRRKAGEACHRWTECEGACVAPKGGKDGKCEAFCGSG